VRAGKNPRVVVGRTGERARLRRLVDRARQGESGVLVLRGEAGMGKTTLLDEVADRTEHVRLVRLRGIESEARLAFAGLHALLGHAKDALRALPARQLRLLQAVVGVGDAAAVDPVGVGAALLTLLAEMAVASPLLVVLDDAQWLDRESARTLGFAARRLDAEPVALIIATRGPDDVDEGLPFPTEGLPELVLGPLSLPDARELLRLRAPQLAASEHAVDHAFTATGGNPLALVEWPAQATDAQLAGAAPVFVPTSLEETYARRVGLLGDRTRTALALAAAEGRGRLAVVGPALAALDLDVDDLVGAEQAGLVSIRAGELAFRHPLIAAAAYQALEPASRRQIHGALASVLGRQDERRAWHRAESVLGSDEDAASELESVARAALGRGAWDAASRGYERAGRLSASPRSAARRLEKAAAAAEAAGRSAHALALLDEAVGLVDARAAAEMVVRRAELGLGRDPARVRERALSALKDVRQPLARARLLETAATAGAYLHDDPEAFLSYSEAAWNERHRAGRVTASSLREIGVALLRTGRTAEAVPKLEASLAHHPANRGDVLAAGELAIQMHGDHDEARGHLRRALATARRAGALGDEVEPHVLLSACEREAGNWNAAVVHAHAARELATASGQTWLVGAALASACELAALRGDSETLSSLLAELSGEWPDLTARVAAATQGVHAFVHRRFAEAAAYGSTLRTLAPRAMAAGTAPSGLFAEAHVRVGRADEAETWLADTVEAARLWPNPVNRAERARVRALLAGDEAFDEAFEEALAMHEHVGHTHYLAHTQLCYGERLRRVGRRRDARVQLRAALETFERIGAGPWAAWAAEELGATGEQARRRDPSTLDQLTPQELVVAAAVASGLSNRQAAERLFLSQKTIEKHLSNAYRKLGVHNRLQLAARVAGGSPPQR
jgi:DNA-binding CsgD family transcriptional regulator